MKILLLVASLQLCAAYKILVYSPGLSNSHLMFNGRIADLLINAGHDVLIYKPELSAIANKNGSDIARMFVVDVGVKEKWAKTFEKFDDMIFKGSGMSVLDFLDFQKLTVETCDAQLKRKDIMDVLRAEKFDLAISETMEFCSYGIFHHLNIPSNIVLSPGPLMDYMADAFGFPAAASHVPNIMAGFTDEMTYVERAKNLFASNALTYVGRYVASLTTQVFRDHYGNDFPEIYELLGRSPLVLVNSVEILDFTRPVLHKLVYIGGIGMSKPKPLNKKLTKIVESGKKGTVLFSMGSVVKLHNAPLEMKSAIIKALAKFEDYNFIVKTESSDKEMAELASNVKNVYLESWVPQVDLLGHPNVKAFITHGGQNSILETVYAGKPVLTIPCFGDQFRNAATVVRKGFGTRVPSMSVLTVDSLTAALHDLLNNEKYEITARRLSRMLEKKPVKSEDLVVKWTEFVAEFKQLPELESYARQLNFLQLSSLDIVIPFTLVLAVALFILYKVFRLLFRLCFGSSKLKNE
uniref:UDP-glucuronosyltransferase n=1 Tax=Plectus sambesii TaxID=2011161 RepID=A0A914XHB5_9BILA